MRFAPKALAVTSALALSLTVTACAPVGSGDGGGEKSDATAAYEDAQNMSDGERMDKIVEAAEKEGKVSVFLRSDVVFEDIEKAFEDKYDIDLTIHNPGLPTAVYQQIAESSEAGRQQADVVETFSYELELVYPEENLVAEMPKFITEASTDPSLAGKYSVGSFQYPFIPMWNTKEITGGDVPKSLTDFADPVWKGKIVMAKGDFLWSWYKTWFEYLTEEKGMSVDDFEKLMLGIAENASVTDSSNPAAQGIASGQYKGGPNLALTAGQKLGGNAPVAWEPAMEPVVTVPLSTSLIKDAPHPNAAMVFADWYASEGSDIIEKEQFVQQNPQEKDLEGADIKSTDLTKMDMDDIDEWRHAFENLTSGKKDILPESVRDS
ncbi:ABC transporter substrate-binding protein [Brevibacterium sp. VCM10]|uniref:ABC transporter substrate-binding protein n=1 Tax=Brevibacterium sp. VCM10 TaxID=1381751 RepID=UPI00046F7920|nr:ABC transporter substrate-binding protein [Brevibacterium sp. VCM10]